MKRNRIFLTLLFVGFVLPMCCQDFLHEYFKLDTLSKINPLDDMTHLVYDFTDGVFCYTESTAFRKQGQEYTATFYLFDIGHYTLSERHLSVPINVLKSLGSTIQPWIYDFQFSNDYCVVSLQDIILLFKSEGERYLLDTTYECQNVKLCYLYQGDLFYLEEDHDFGYRWYRLHDGQRVVVRPLQYEAPHVVQAKPNRYLFRDDHFLYFLSNRYPSLEKYGLNGDWLERITFDLPSWHPFEDEYIKKSLKVPYGVERIRATMDEIYNYSYPKVVFPLGGDYLLYYTQYDTTTHKSKLYFAIRNADGTTKCYPRKVPSELLYTGDALPMTLLENRVDKAWVSWNNILVEILLADTVDASGLTDLEYRQRREDFYLKSEPFPAIKVSSYKTEQQEYLPAFYNSHGLLQSLSNLPVGKHILVLNNELDCSGCRKTLFSWLNEQRDKDFFVDVVYPYFPGAMTRYDWRMDVCKYLEKPFQMLFLDKDRYEHYPKFGGIPYRSFPGILLYETGHTPLYLPLEEIFEDNSYANIFRETFLKQVNDFLKRK
ncbi:MAG: hypothetical protein K6A41_07555 [Bacteroidales bacterium]|nr:hypothetical protein [Bacteroidales bacterium]